MAERMAERVPVPRLVSREASMWVAGGVAVLGVVAVSVYFALDSATRVPAIVVGALLLLGLGILLSRRTWLDTVNGRVVRETARVYRREVPWAEARTVGVRSNNAGQALLQVQGGRGSAWIPLVAVDVGGDRTQKPEFLELLADEVERWAPERGAVVKQLRAQAAHVVAGGAVRDSPIARAHLARR
jgi:hypothetical protein